MGQVKKAAIKAKQEKADEKRGYILRRVWIQFVVYGEGK